jgi:hypothetical protein
MQNYLTIDKRTGLSPIQGFTAYLGGSMFQIVMDNPITAYRQLVQQYAKSADGTMVSPAMAKADAKLVFYRNPVAASLSGLGSRLVGVCFKRIPKFGFLFGYTTMSGRSEPGFAAATVASICSAPFINPIRMIEKQQRVDLKTTGVTKSVRAIIVESSHDNFRPLFRGTIPLMGHSFASAVLGIVGQPKLQKKIQKEVGTRTSLGNFAANLVASTVVTPFYVFLTNPLSRLEVIMQTASVNHKRVSVTDAVRELVEDRRRFGLVGVFRGSGIGIVKAIISLSLFHEGRLFCIDRWKDYNGTRG